MRITFICSPFNLLQTDNGGSISMRALVRELSLAGVQCEVLSHIMTNAGSAVTVRSRTWTEDVGHGSIRHHLVIAPARAPRQERIRAFVDMASARLRATRPDLVMSWPFEGAWGVDRIHDLAHELGCPVVMHLLTHTTSALERFGRSADELWVPSVFMRRACKRAFHGPVRTLYPCVDDARCMATSRSPEHVTFINPIPVKGLTLFLRLVSIAQEERPELRFLVVESRGTARQLAKLGVARSVLWNVDFMPRTDDPTEIYRRTKVLLVPSFWEEAFGMVVVEAQRNGIPVLASRRGGIMEALGGAAAPLAIPARCAKDHIVIPTEREVSRWRTRLWRLLDDAEEYAVASARARTASNQCTPNMIRAHAMELADAALARARRLGLSGAARARSAAQRGAPTTGLFASAAR